MTGAHDGIVNALIKYMQQITKQILQHAATSCMSVMTTHYAPQKCTCVHLQISATHRSALS